MLLISIYDLHNFEKQLVMKVVFKVTVFKISIMKILDFMSRYHLSFIQKLHQLKRSVCKCNFGVRIAINMVVRVRE